MGYIVTCIFLLWNVIKTVGKNTKFTKRVNAHNLLVNLHILIDITSEYNIMMTETL